MIESSLTLSSARFSEFFGSKWHLSELKSLLGMLNILSIWADVTGIWRNVIHKCNGLLIIVEANCEYNFHEVKFSITNYNYDHKKFVISYN